MMTRFIYSPYVAHVLLALIMAFVLYAGIIGVDFGYHWDEHHFIHGVRCSIENGVLLPSMYAYPSMCYNLYLMAAAPSVARAFLSPDAREKEKAIGMVESPPFKLRVRVIFIALSSLSILWTYLLVGAWRKNWLEALLAACLLGLSWEVAYHSRWAVPDAVTMQFGALSAMCVFFAANHDDYDRKKAWLVLAAAAAGLTIGTKYSVALILAPIFIAAYYYSFKKDPPGKAAYIFFKIILVSGIAYLATTPGTVLEPVKFFREVEIRRLDYFVNGHVGHTVSPGAGHLWLILIYFCMAVFSRYKEIAAFFFLLALIGAFALVKEEKKKAAIFLSFPVSYIVFLSCAKTMIVRNLLILVPFFAVLASRGFAFLRDGAFSKSRLLRRSFSVLVIAALAVNAVWLAGAAVSVKDRQRTNYTEKLASYLDRHNGTAFFISERVYEKLKYFDTKIRPNLKNDLSAADGAIFYSSEVDWTQWTCNRFDYTWAWFGPYEVNFNYYPLWAGDNRIVVMSAASARKLRVFPGGENSGANSSLR